MTRGGGGLVAALALAAACLVAGPAAAQGVSDANRAAYMQLYNALLKDPGNPDLNLKFAEEAEKVGDLEGAISALERLLVSHPGLVRARLELGVLYAKLGSYDMAKAYLEPLADGSDTPPDTRAAAQRQLRAISGLATGQHFYASLFFGSQWQTDPGSSPGSPNFLIGGTPTPSNQAFSKRSDENLFAQGAGRYSIDLPTPYNETFEVDGLGYGASYRRLHELDTLTGDAALGPRLSTERIGISGGTIKPYAILDFVRLGGAPYDNSYGGGIDYTQALGGALPTLDFDYEARQGNYNDTQNYPTARLYNGRLDHYSLDLTEALGEVSSVSLAGVYNRQNTRFSGYSNDDFAAVATLTVGYTVDFLPLGYPWVTSVSIARHWIYYDGADPSVAAGTNRSDRRFQVSLSQIVPITDHISLAAVIYRDYESSNIPNYSYGNTSVLIGPKITF